MDFIHPLVFLYEHAYPHAETQATGSPFVTLKMRRGEIDVVFADSQVNFIRWCGSKENYITNPH